MLVQKEVERIASAGVWEQIPANTPGIYAIVNVQNRRAYIGSSKCVARRLTSHKVQMTAGSHASQALDADVKIYGVESFSAGLIETFTGRVGALLVTEFAAIVSLPAEDRYNITPCGGYATMDVIKQLLWAGDCQLVFNPGSSLDESVKKAVEEYLNKRCTCAERQPTEPQS